MFPKTALSRDGLYLRQVCNQQNFQSIEEHVRGDYEIWEYLQPFCGFLRVNFLTQCQIRAGAPTQEVVGY